MTASDAPAPEERAGEEARRGEPDMRPILDDLERGVRLELFVAPVVLLLPVVTAGVLAWMAWVHGEPRLVALAAVVWLGNAVFGLLMVKAILRFLHAAGLAPDGGGEPGSDL